MDPMLRDEEESQATGRLTLDNIADTNRSEAKNEASQKTEEYVVNETKPKELSQLKTKNSIGKLAKNPKKVILIAVVAAVVITGAIFLAKHLTAPLHITKVETLLAMSSRTENPPVQEKFTTTDPIMLYFEYSGAGVGTAVKFEVKNSDGEIVKSGSTTVLRETGDDKADGKRYASIVNMPSTALPAGNYTVTLSFDGHSVGSTKFEVEK